ncbi:MAG: hypothetical protein JSU03_03565 [Bacteroidetes bacterium]|nr:hypothetical protein [Bacteroidota bacterium]MBS1756333.1 hypothetical protein [Bacteroidota bacterium]
MSSKSISNIGSGCTLQPPLRFGFRYHPAARGQYSHYKQKLSPLQYCTDGEVYIFFIGCCHINRLF